MNLVISHIYNHTYIKEIDTQRGNLFEVFLGFCFNFGSV